MINWLKAELSDAQMCVYYITCFFKLRTGQIMFQYMNLMHTRGKGSSNVPLKFGFKCVTSPTFLREIYKKWIKILV